MCIRDSFHMDRFAAGWYEQYLALVPDDPDSTRMREMVKRWEGVNKTPPTVE